MELRELSKAKTGLIRALRTARKQREKNRAFVLEGERLVDELRMIPNRVRFLFGTREGLYRLGGGLADFDAYVTEDRDLFDTETPQGIGAVVAMTPDWAPGEIARRDGPLLLLDRIGDPGNAGTIIRAADWFGAAGILFSKGCVDPFNPKSVRASMGGILRVPVSLDVTPEEVAALDLPLFVLDADGENALGAAPLPAHGVYVIGSEAHGVDEVWRRSGAGVSIPGSGEGESLNAAMAAAILLFDLHSAAGRRSARPEAGEPASRLDRSKTR